KMSKSDENDRSYISMLDTPKKMEKKIKSAVTDSDGIVKYDKEKKPGVSNLIDIYASCTLKSVSEIENEFSSKGYGDFKSAVANEVVQLLRPIQEKYEKLINSTELDDILTMGAKKASKVAEVTLSNAKKKMGMLRL